MRRFLRSFLPATALGRAIVVLLLAAGAPAALLAQISWNNVVSQQLEVCQDGQTFVVSFTNQTGSTLTGVTLNMQMPHGISYVTGSLSETTSFNVQEQNVSNPQNVTFSMNDVPHGQTVSFNVTLEAGFAALAWLDAGNVFRNTLILNYNGGSDTTQTNSYNVLYAALTITGFSPSTASVYVGQTFTRTVTIVNGGYGSLSSFVLKDTYDSNYLQLVSTDLGTVNTSTGEITFPIMQRLCGPAITVSDEDALRAMAAAFLRLKLVAEPGGAVALAAALFLPDQISGEAVITVATGGNVDAGVFAEALSRHAG